MTKASAYALAFFMLNGVTMMKSEAKIGFSSRKSAIT